MLFNIVSTDSLVRSFIQSFSMNVCHTSYITPGVVYLPVPRYTPRVVLAVRRWHRAADLRDLDHVAALPAGHGHGRGRCAGRGRAALPAGHIEYNIDLVDN